MVYEDYTVLSWKHLSGDALQVLAACTMMFAVNLIEHCYTCKIQGN